ncbi:MAG: hypothetical protein HQ564_09630 [Candidatus Saganbacteria bacterium]|nr:hypothetical protein [Candidatus Saganbacteria bacterium]
MTPGASSARRIGAPARQFTNPAAKLNKQTVPLRLMPLQLLAHLSVTRANLEITTLPKSFGELGIDSSIAAGLLASNPDIPEQVLAPMVIKGLQEIDQAERSATTNYSPELLGKALEIARLRKLGPLPSITWKALIKSILNSKNGEQIIQLTRHISNRASLVEFCEALPYREQLVGGYSSKNDTQRMVEWGRKIRNGILPAIRRNSGESIADQYLSLRTDTEKNLFLTIIKNMEIGNSRLTIAKCAVLIGAANHIYQTITENHDPLATIGPVKEFFTVTRAIIRSTHNKKVLVEGALDALETIGFKKGSIAHQLAFELLKGDTQQAVKRLREDIAEIQTSILSLVKYWISKLPFLSGINSKIKNMLSILADLIGSASVPQLLALLQSAEPKVVSRLMAALESAVRAAAPTTPKERNDLEQAKRTVILFQLNKKAGAWNALQTARQLLDIIRNIESGNLKEAGKLFGKFEAGNLYQDSIITAAIAASLGIRTDKYQEELKSSLAGKNKERLASALSVVSKITKPQFHKDLQRIFKDTYGFDGLFMFLLKNKIQERVTYNYSEKLVTLLKSDNFNNLLSALLEAVRNNRKIDRALNILARALRSEELLAPFFAESKIEQILEREREAIMRTLR